MKKAFKIFLLVIFVGLCISCSGDTQEIKYLIVNGQTQDSTSPSDQTSDQTEQTTDQTHDQTSDETTGGTQDTADNSTSETQDSSDQTEQTTDQTHDQTSDETTGGTQDTADNSTSETQDSSDQTEQTTDQTHDQTSDETTGGTQSTTDDSTSETEDSTEFTEETGGTDFFCEVLNDYTITVNFPGYATGFIVLQYKAPTWSESFQVSSLRGTTTIKFLFTGEVCDNTTILVYNDMNNDGLLNNEFEPQVYVDPLDVLGSESVTVELKYEKVQSSLGIFPKWAQYSLNPERDFYMGSTIADFAAGDLVILDHSVFENKPDVILRIFQINPYIKFFPYFNSVNTPANYYSKERSTYQHAVTELLATNPAVYMPGVWNEEYVYKLQFDPCCIFVNFTKHVKSKFAEFFTQLAGLRQVFFNSLQQDVKSLITGMFEDDIHRDIAWISISGSYNIQYLDANYDKQNNDAYPILGTNFYQIDYDWQQGIYEYLTELTRYSLPIIANMNHFWRTYPIQGMYKENMADGYDLSDFDSVYPIITQYPYTIWNTEITKQEDAEAPEEAKKQQLNRCRNSSILASMYGAYHACTSPDDNKNYYVPEYGYHLGYRVWFEKQPVGMQVAVFQKGMIFYNNSLYPINFAFNRTVYTAENIPFEIYLFDPGVATVFFYQPR